MRWIDLNSKEFKALPNFEKTLLFTIKAVRLGAMIADRHGNLYINNGSNTPIVDFLPSGEKVGVCHKALAES